MSGAEAILVLGVISSIISIIDGTKQVYDAATNAQGLPEAFCEIAGRLLIVKNILGSAKQYIDKGDVNEDSCKGVKHVVEACEKKARKLDELFHKAIPEDGASGVNRYYKAVKAYGKGNEVEKLMEGILKDIQLLVGERGMKNATEAQKEQIVEAIVELSDIQPSVPDQKTGFVNQNYGPGSQYIAQGEQHIAQGNARQYVSSGGAMHFGDSIFYTDTQSASVLRSKEEEACLSALFLTDPGDDRKKLIETKGSRVDGTCEWIKSNKLYHSWLQSHSQLLWLSGGPGKGKTMLSIFLAEELERTAQLSEDMLFLQYFCDNKDEKRNTAATIIRGLIFQLLQSQRKLFDHILPSFKIGKESLFTNSSFETLWGIFKSIICDPILNTTYCILDGLDECDEDSLEVLLRKFAALFSAKTYESSACHLKLVLVSRDLPDFIPELLSSFPRIRLDPDADTEVNDDIHRFIQVEVDKLSANRQYPEPLCVYVKEVFRDRAQGTFLWVGIVARALKKYKASQVEKALDLFPSGLNEVYARILLQIDINRREIAAKILRWVVMAVRPLTLPELGIAINAADERSVAFSCDDVTRDHVLDCGYFLTIKEDKVNLIHQSAKDYLLLKTQDLNPELEVFRVKEEAVNLEIARKCLDYLHNSAFAAGEVDTNTDTYPLLYYAAIHWHEHARSLSRSADIFDLTLPFYQKKSKVRQSWLKMLRTERRDRRYPPRSSTLLHLASCFGILPLVENLLLKQGWIDKVKRKFYLNKKDSRGMTALMWAAREGHQAVVQLLLKKGADMNAKDNDGATVLHQAAFSGHEAVMQLLSETGANTKAKTINGQTALHFAARMGHRALVQLLLEKGADVEAKDNNSLTPLIIAILHRREAIVRLLPEKGANVNARYGSGMTALLLAIQTDWSTQKNITIVQVLLEKGADIEAKDDMRGWTALTWAVLYGFEATGRLLLENGANVNAKNGDGYTALMFAVQHCMSLQDNNENIVRLLLEKGANTNAKDDDGKTALMLSIEDGWQEVDKLKIIVQLLLEKGANINAEDNKGWTPMHHIGNKTHDVIIELLLEAKAKAEAEGNIKATNGYGITTIEQARALRLQKGLVGPERQFPIPHSIIYASWGDYMYNELQEL